MGHLQPAPYYLPLTKLSSTRLALILGAQSEFKCPVCLVPTNKLWDLCGAAHPKRTRDKTLTLIVSANEESSVSATKRRLVMQSIRGISVGSASIVLRH